MNFEKYFGENVKKFRLKRKLSQEQLAEMLEVSSNTISKIERGKSFVTSDTLKKIIKVLDVRPHELFVFKNQETTEFIYNDVMKFLKLDKIKNDARFLLLLHELIREHLEG